MEEKEAKSTLKVCGILCIILGVFGIILGITTFAGTQIAATGLISSGEIAPEQADGMATVTGMLLIIGIVAILAAIVSLLLGIKNEREHRVVSKKKNKKTGKVINPYGFPKFKKKYKTADSFYQRTDSFHTVGRRGIKITGIKRYVRCKYAVHIPEHVVNPRVKWDNGHWYLSYSYEVDDVPEVSFK
jgi:hypothetical protein